MYFALASARQFDKSNSRPQINCLPTATLARLNQEQSAKQQLTPQSTFNLSSSQFASQQKELSLQQQPQYPRSSSLSSSSPSSSSSSPSSSSSLWKAVAFVSTLGLFASLALIATHASAILLVAPSATLCFILLMVIITQRTFDLKCESDFATAVALTTDTTQPQLQTADSQVQFKQQQQQQQQHLQCNQLLQAAMDYEAAKQTAICVTSLPQETAREQQETISK